VSDCIVIAVLNGIEISHKLFMPEMVTDPRSVRGCESVLGMPLCITSAVVDYPSPRRDARRLEARKAYRYSQL